MRLAPASIRHHANRTRAIDVPRRQSLKVAAGGSVPLGIVISAVDSDDVMSVSISGVPNFESVTAAGVTPMVTQHGGLFTYTFNALPTADWNNGLILKSSYTGKGQPTNQLTVTMSNVTTGESSTAPAKTITVTDPPAASTFGSNDGSQLEISGPATLAEFYSNNTIAPPMVSDGTHAASLALLQYTAGSLAQSSDGHAGSLISEPPPSPQQQFLTQPHT
jgi:hypothetical protein